MKFATLFGGAGKNRESKEYKETILIGAFLSQQGYTIKNGGYGGMMEAVSKGTTQENGKAIGITCKQVGSEVGNTFLSETVVTETLYHRLQLLIEETTLFVVQRGGIGTLSEMFLTLDILRKDRSSDRPKVFLVGEFWIPVVEVLKKNLVPKYEHELFKVVRDFEEFKQEIVKQNENKP